MIPLIIGIISSTCIIINWAVTVPSTEDIENYAKDKYEAEAVKESVSKETTVCPQVADYAVSGEGNVIIKPAPSNEKFTHIHIVYQIDLEWDEVLGLMPKTAQDVTIDATPYNDYFYMVTSFGEDTAMVASSPDHIAIPRNCSRYRIGIVGDAVVDGMLLTDTIISWDKNNEGVSYYPTRAKDNDIEVVCEDGICIETDPEESIEPDMVWSADKSAAFSGWIPDHIANIIDKK